MKNKKELQEQKIEQVEEKLNENEKEELKEKIEEKIIENKPEVKEEKIEEPKVIPTKNEEIKGIEQGIAEEIKKKVNELKSEKQNDINIPKKKKRGRKKKNKIEPSPNLTSFYLISFGITLLNEKILKNIQHGQFYLDKEILTLDGELLSEKDFLVKIWTPVADEYLAGKELTPLQFAIFGTGYVILNKMDKDTLNNILNKFKRKVNKK